MHYLIVRFANSITSPVMIVDYVKNVMSVKWGKLRMGYAQIIRRVEAHELTNCDDCGNDELTSSGRYITDSSHQPVIWFCFNCVHKTTR